jgi:g-D-glutamyl-meso-diaminopimelate peptidase
MPYVIQPGDTWFRLAERKGLPFEELAMINRNMHPDPTGYLVPGQVIFVPSHTERERHFISGNGDINLITGSGPYGYMELMRHIQQFMIRYPFVQVEWIGHSVMGRPIPVIRVGIGSCEVHFNGAFHANEWITTPLLMRFVERMAAAVWRGEGMADKEARFMKQLYDRVSLWIVPMVNPDGVELVHCGIWPGHPYGILLQQWNKGNLDFSGWKANIHGVDLNDQFPAFWEEERDRRLLGAPCPGPRDYTGTAPLTEPEAQAMAQFTRCRNFQLAIAFHTQGEEIYWNYRGLEPSVSEGIAERLGLASGYNAVKLSGSDAGYKDWFILQFRRPGFTVELGQGVNPLPIEQFGPIYSRMEPQLLEAMSIACELEGCH